MAGIAAGTSMPKVYLWGLATAEELLKGVSFAGLALAGALIAWTRSGPLALLFGATLALVTYIEVSGGAILKAAFSHPKPPAPPGFLKEL